QDYDSDKANYGVVADHPELIDINFADAGQADWIHANAIDYNPELDQIIISCHSFNEFWVIDHSPTAAQAAGHSGGNSGRGGDILYRWGNPQSYRAGDASDQTLFRQHDAQWVEPDFPGADFSRKGNILIFNNGNHRPEGSYSSVDEIAPAVDANGHYILVPGSAYGPEKLTWTYTAENPGDFYADKISGAQRL
ncbi:MAG: arylsulfotransferase (ASST), partial [bacterium]|nr:arylsulfotransferase (ASST) [bacterium]